MKRCFTKQYSNLKSFCFTSFSLYLLVCGVHAFANMNQWCLHVKGLHIVFILNDQEALVWRAEAHLIAERWDDAVRDMQRAVELNQNDQAAQVPTLAYASHSGICLTHSGICLTHSGICLTHSGICLTENEILSTPLSHASGMFCTSTHFTFLRRRGCDVRSGC